MRRMVSSEGWWAFWQRQEGNDQHQEPDDNRNDHLTVRHERAGARPVEVAVRSRGGGEHNGTATSKKVVRAGE